MLRGVPHDEKIKERTIRFEVLAASETYSGLGVIGNVPQLGSWDLNNLVRLKEDGIIDGHDGTTKTRWISEAVSLLPFAFPFRFRIVANGHRSRPNKRPLVWDVESRHVLSMPEDGVVRIEFGGDQDGGCDSGFVHSSGTGAFQLRVESPPGSADPIVSLMEEYDSDDWSVELFEAIPKDPNFPEGKTFGKVTCEDVDIPSITAHGHAACTQIQSPVTYVMNAQSIEHLEFRIDVVKGDGSVLARGFVTAESIRSLEGNITAPLISIRDLKLAGRFHATYLVVHELHHPKNTICEIQRRPWSSLSQMTLDIGHRGSGASKVQGHSVRENTLLSFQKAAINHSDLIEFDVHLTADNEAVVHHDFEVNLSLSGSDQIKVALPLLTSDQIRSAEFAQNMVTPTEHDRGKKIKEERNKRESTLKRTMTSGEDMFRTLFYKPNHSVSPDAIPENMGQMRVFLSDNAFASLRQAFKNTPSWLGFNIELKYPTDQEILAMGTRWYSRNHFVDTVLSTVLEEFQGRRVIFSTFDPACAELLRLKQCKFSVFFLTCGGSRGHVFPDPRMNSVEAALQFAKTSRLQGVVAEIESIVDNLEDIVSEFHSHGLHLFTYGDLNNDIKTYSRQKLAGIDAIIMDDVARIGKETNKKASLLSKGLRSPCSLAELCSDPSIHELQMLDLTSQLSMATMSPIGSPSSY